MSFIDLTNQKFGRLTVLEQDFSGLVCAYQACWICDCECGEQIIVRSQALRSGNTKSCGCLAHEIKKTVNIIHGDSGSRLFKIWIGIKQRCLNSKNKHYKYYGGRGITICERWLDYVNFKEDMHKSYLEHINLHGESDTTIDRTNKNGNYELNNCKWSTRHEQILNRKVMKKFKATYIEPGESFGYVEFCDNREEFAEKYGLTRSAISQCLHGKQKQTHDWIFEFVDEVVVENGEIL